MASYFEDITPARTAPSAGIKSIPRPKKRPVNPKVAHMNQVKRHFEILGTDNPFERAHGLMRGSIASGGSGADRPYKDLKDLGDGGGPGRSGSRFFMRDTSAMDTNNDGYISEEEAITFQNKDRGAYNKAVGGIGAVSNALGIRPLGSYENERTRGPRGTNIGTSGLANYFAGGGPFGALFGGGPNAKQRAMPSMDANQRFTFENLKASGMSDEEAIKFLGSNYSPPAPSTYTSTDYLMDASRYNPPINMNMGGIMQLANFGRSV
jgi:hypothetical protein